MNVGISRALSRVLAGGLVAAGIIGAGVAMAERPATRESDSGARDQSTRKVEVLFTGGHDTDPRDHGRPVVLVAAGLNVPADVFRKAFSGVTPAREGDRPTGGQVRRNKEALLRVLAPYGVTNDRLDEVSDYYRYQPGRGQLWRSRPAKAVATIEGDVVKSIDVTDPGSGYSSPPHITIPGFSDTSARVELNFGTDLKTNGSVRSAALLHE